ncbi:MAG: diguanylate cyclase (GGDEF)-like protein [Cognaticolwellia sp.]|jgi:diguanylate cyclase (GGDEF)-like protein
MAVHRSGLGRLRANFTTVLDQQVASLSWLSRQAAGDPDLLDALVAELSRLQATAQALDLLEVARAADRARRAATEGGLQGKIDALLEVCRSLDGSRPVFRPLLVMEPDEASAMRLRMRARSCAVQVDFYGETDELVRSARGDRPFAVVLPILALEKVAAAFRQDDKLATIPLYVFQTGGADIEHRMQAIQAGAAGWVAAPIDIPNMIWRIREQIGEAEPHQPRLLLVGPKASQDIAGHLDPQAIHVSTSLSADEMLGVLQDLAPDLVVIDAEYADRVLPVLRGHERWNGLSVSVYGDAPQASISTADLLLSSLDPKVVAHQIMGRAERLLTQNAAVLFDSATGVLSRNALLAVADREVGLSLRNGIPNATCLLELDDWERFVEDNGPGRSQHVLRMVARTLQSSLRETDAVGRVGKSTLALVLMACTTDQAKRRIRGIQHAFAETHKDDEVLSKITFTVGVADTLGGPALLQRSEMALHRARLSGHGSIDN